MTEDDKCLIYEKVKNMKPKYLGMLDTTYAVEILLPKLEELHPDRVYSARSIQKDMIIWFSPMT